MTTYYIQDQRQSVGNSLLWWRPDGRGYTTNLSQAGLFAEAELRNLRDTDVPWPSDYIDRIAKLHVDYQDADMSKAIKNKQ